MARPKMIKVAVAFFAATCFSTLPTQAQAPQGQDQLEKITGQRLVGRVERVSNGQVLFNIGVGSVPIPFNQIKSIQMAPPQAYAQAMALMEKQSYKQASQVLAGIVDQYKGLPLDWAQRSMSSLADAYIELNQGDKAQATFAELQRFYPNAPVSAEKLAVMKAKIALAAKKYAEAKAVLVPIATTALTKKEVTRQDGSTYGQVFLALGQIYEEENKQPEALEAYLRTTTIFYQDPAAASAAQAKADALRKKNETLVVP